MATAAPNAVREELRQLMKLAGPVVLARLGIMGMGLCDAIVVGRFSAEQLGFHALGWAPTAVVLTMAVGLLAGVQVMAARVVGEGRPREAGAVLRRGLVYSVWIGLAAMALLLAGGPAFLHVIGLDPALADGASRPLMIFALSLPPYTLSVAASFWLEGVSRPGPAAWIMLAANVVNLALDLLLAPGTFGLPAMGAVGAGLATLGARVVLAGATLAYIFAMKEARAFGVYDKPVRDRAAEAEQRRIGFGAGLSNLFEVAAFNSLNVIAGWLGALAVAGFTVVLNVASIIFMVPLGLGTAAAVRVSAAYGAGDATGVRRAAWVAMGVTGVFGLAVALAVWPAAGAIVRLYTEDRATLALALPALTLACLMFVPDALQVVAATSLRARGDVWVPTVTHLTSYILVMAPLAAFLAVRQGLEVQGIVLAIVCASSLSAALLCWRLWAVIRRG